MSVPTIALGNEIGAFCARRDLAFTRLDHHRRPRPAWHSIFRAVRRRMKVSQADACGEENDEGAASLFPRIQFADAFQVRPSAL